MRKHAQCFFLAALLLTVLISAAAAASETEEEPVKKYSIFYMNSQGTQIGEDEFVPEIDTPNTVLQGLIDTYNTGHRDSVVRYLPNNITISTWSMEDGTLNLNLSSEYLELSASQEVLVRAAFVRTFTQLSEVLFVMCLVDGEEIKDALGEPVGRMSSDTFVEVNSADRESYRYDSFTLYFADKDGRRLIPEKRRVYYRRSIPKARVALEQLANGPMEKGSYPTISSDVTLQSVTLSDGICYVDFDSIFTEQPVPEISPEMAVYSVVHTLIANTETDRVEIMVDGKSEAVFGELELYQFFSWNDELSERP